MCGRYGQNEDEELIRELFGVGQIDGDSYGLTLNNSRKNRSSSEIVSDNPVEYSIDKVTGEQENIGSRNVNTSPGNFSIMILSSGGEKKMVYASFGFKPHWAGKSSYLAINARSEGDFNKEDDPSYKGPMGIFSKSYFKEAIMLRRCILPVNYFIEGPKKERLSVPYVVRRGDGEMFGLGAIWEKYTERESGRSFINFAVITTPSNSITQKIGHHRAPLVIADNKIDHWMDHDLRKNEISDILHPFDDRLFFAYRVDKKIKTPNYRGTANNDEKLIQPIEPPIFPDNYEGPDPRKVFKDLKFPDEQSNLF